MLKTEKPVIDPAKAWAARSLKHDRQLICCRFSPCGRILVAGGIDNLLHRWDLETEQKSTLAGHTSWVAAVAFHPKSEADRLFSADYHGVVHCWSYAVGAAKPVWTIPQADQGWVRTLSVSLDGKLLATGGDDRLVRLWSTETGKLVKELEPHKGYVSSTRFHPDGKTLVSGDLFGVVRQWDLGTFKAVRELDASALHTRKEHWISDVGGVRAMAFDAGGTQFACSGITRADNNTVCSGTPTVLLFDWATGKQTVQMRVKEKTEGYLNGLCYLPDGTLAAYGQGVSSAGLSFWKPGQAETFHSIPGATGYDLDLHPDGRRLAAALYENVGKNDNGRDAKATEYVPNGGVIRIFHLFDQAASPA